MVSHEPLRTKAGALRFLAWIGLLLGSWAGFFLLLQSLFGRQVDRLQVLRLGRELALQVRLTELTLERYPPVLIKDLTGLHGGLFILKPKKKI